jgi:hypothetical protein
VGGSITRHTQYVPKPLLTTLIYIPNDINGVNGITKLSIVLPSHIVIKSRYKPAKVLHYGRCEAPGLRTIQKNTEDSNLVVPKLKS